MIKKYFTILLIVALIVSLFSTLIIHRSSKQIQGNNLKLKSDLNDCEYISLRYKEKYNQTIFSENKDISNVSLLDNNLDTILLANVIDNIKLVYRFYEETCVQCVEDELDIVKQLADSIGSKNVLIISDFNKMNSLKSIINRKQIKSPYFTYRERFELPIEEDEQEVASFFLLDKNLRTQFVYKAGGDQDINDPYYKRIIDFFKTGK